MIIDARSSSLILTGRLVFLKEVRMQLNTVTLTFFTEHSGLIGITEPRRVAAISMAQRVAMELGMEFGKEIGYQVSFLKWSTGQIVTRRIVLATYSALFDPMGFISPVAVPARLCYQRLCRLKKEWDEMRRRFDPEGKE